MARLKLQTAYTASDQKWLLISAKPDPFSKTIRMILIKYITGFSLSRFCAHCGMLSMDVNRPLIRIKTPKKKERNEHGLLLCLGNC